jgi:hypothetical protein
VITVEKNIMLTLTEQKNPGSAPMIAKATGSLRIEQDKTIGHGVVAIQSELPSPNNSMGNLGGRLVRELERKKTDAEYVEMPKTSMFITSFQSCRGELMTTGI